MANISTFIPLLVKVIIFVLGLGEVTYSLKFTVLLNNGSTGLYIEKRQNHISDFQSSNDQQPHRKTSNQG